MLFKKNKKTMRCVIYEENFKFLTDCDEECREEWTSNKVNMKLEERYSKISNLSTCTL